MIKLYQNEIEILRKAVSTYGSETQLRQLQEECGELIVAINHMLRNRLNGSIEFLAEFVDVYIVMGELFYSMKSHQEFTNIFDNKLKKLEEKLKEVNSHE